MIRLSGTMRVVCDSLAQLQTLLRVIADAMGLMVKDVHANMPAKADLYQGFAILAGIIVLTVVALQWASHCVQSAMDFCVCCWTVRRLEQINARTYGQYLDWRKRCDSALASPELLDQIPDMPVFPCTVENCPAFINFLGCKCSLKRLLSAKGEIEHQKILIAEKRRWDPKRNIFLAATLSYNNRIFDQVQELSEILEELMEEKTEKPVRRLYGSPEL